MSDEELIVPHANFELNKSQHVAGVRMFVDQHPDDEGGPGTEMDPADGAYDRVTETAVEILDVANMESGRHIVYFQVTDSLGYRGAVSAAFFHVPDSGDVPLEADPRSHAPRHFTSTCCLVLLLWGLFRTGTG